MRILFLNPASLDEKVFMKEIGRCGSTATADQIWPQTGLAYLAAIVEEQNNESMIIDGMIEKISIKNLISKIKKFKPNLIIVHTTTPTFNNDKEIVRNLKKNFDSKIGFVGTHVSSVPEISLKHSDADFILLNEPELTLKELVNNISGDWRQITGLCFKNGKTIFRNNKRKPAKNIDSLPFPARHLLLNNKYRMILTNNEPFVTVIPSRGCSYKCIYCRKGITWGENFVMRTPSNIYEEIKMVVDSLGIKNIAFMSDTFTLIKSWVIELCNLIIKNNLNIKWWCNSRVDTLDIEMAKLMKEAGCQMISFGVESGEQKILDVSKKQTKVEDAIKAIKIARNANIKTFSYFVLGLPGENWNSINKTIKFAKKLNADYANFHIATPFPGTELFSIAEKNNWIFDKNLDHYDQSGNYVVSRNKDLSQKDLLLARRIAMRKFYFRPKQLLRELKNINSLKDLEIRFNFARKMLFNKFK